MTSRSRSRLEMEVFATETGADGTEYQVGCACDDHDDDTNWIQCTEANCDIWYCEDNIKETTGASKEDLEKLRESSTLFKCSIHGLQDIHFDAEKENDNVVSIYNFRKRTKRQSLKEIDDEIDALSNSNSNSHEAKSNKRNKSKKGKPRINKRKKTSSNKNTTRMQMDLIRFAAIDNKAMEDAAKSIVSIERKLIPYLRDENKAAELIVIIMTNKSTQGRLFGKNRDLAVIGCIGNKNNKWSQPESIVLKFGLLFVVQFPGALRYDSSSSPISNSNVNVIHRVYNSFILKENLDIAYQKEFRERKSKAIKDKMVWCSKLGENEPNGVLLDIKNILEIHLKINKFRKEPSSGNEALQQAQIKQLQERNKSMHRKLKQSKSDKMDKVLDLLAINLKHTMPGNNQVHKSAEEDTIEDELDAAMKGLCDDSSDVELILPPDIEKKDKSFQEEKKQAIEPVFTRQSVVETTSPAIFSNHDSRRKIHGFIDELTSNDAINDEDKQEICLAIYHVSLSKDVCLYLESLLSTRKSLADIARNLLWFINCLKKREDKL